MADKGWTSRVATAAGAAAGTGAAQLGLGYGLGVVVWPVAATSDDSDWLGSLGWATWITASATVFGAVLASRLGGGPATRWSGAWRLAFATSAAVGALVAVALIALPARSAVRDDAFSPQVTAGGYALLGVVLGLVVAYFAVASRPIAANLMATGVLLWALAITAIVVELVWHRDSATYLTSWQFAGSTYGERFGTIFWPSALLTLAAAFLIGVTAVIPALRRGNLGLGASVSGVVGPLLVAVAFLALAPELTGASGPLESAYLIAPYAVLAGLAGSALAVTMGRAAADRRARRAADEAFPDADPVTSELQSASASDKTDDFGHSGGSVHTRTPSEQGNVLSGQPKASGTAAIPAEDPATLPTSANAQNTFDDAPHGGGQGPAEPNGDDPHETPRRRGGFAKLIGRAKIPTQTSPPAREPSDSSPASGDAPLAGPASPAVPDARPTPSTLPEATAARPTSSDASAPASALSGEPARSDASPSESRSPASVQPRAVPSTDAASKRARSGVSARSESPVPDASSARSRTPTAGKEAKGSKSGAARRGGPAASEQADGADPEIAAAARPNRERARKATTSAPRPIKSTVTPPPSEPTIAQINPKPPSEA